MAQENVAAMYVAGEGVKRDNVLGYGWALISRENGGGDAMHSMLGDFDAAQKDQKRALRMAQKLGWDLAPQRERLARYESSSAWTGELLAL